MKKYYLMAIDKGKSSAMISLGFWYEEQGDYKNSLKYYNMGINLNFSETKFIEIFNKLTKDDLTEEIIEILCNLDLSKFKKPPVLLIVVQKLYKSKIDLIDLHFKYAPDGDGAKKAKRDFIYKLINEN